MGHAGKKQSGHVGTWYRPSPSRRRAGRQLQHRPRYPEPQTAGTASAEGRPVQCLGHALAVAQRSPDVQV